jgi:hypothetical protein
MFCAFLLFKRWFSQKLDLKHLKSKYQVMNEFNAKRNFITNAKQKWKNASKIVSHVVKKHAQNASNDTEDRALFLNSRLAN